ncbi:MAG: transposase, partial [Bradymonadaceae bacterium]
MPYLELEGTDVEQLVPELLEEGSLEWILARYRQELFPPWLAAGGPGTRNEEAGRKAWPPQTLMAMCLLRWKGEGMSRRASIRQAADRMSWRAAAGIPLEEDPPSEKTIRRFEQFLMEEHPEVGRRRIVLWHEHVVRLCRQQGVIDDSEAVWVQDST